jgi:hypothetical protein
MYEIADAFEIDENRFQLYGNYLFIRDRNFNQLNFLAPKSIDKPLKRYFSLRKHESKPREKAPLTHDINPMYFNNAKDLKELVHGEILTKTRIMRDGLYNKISHGKLAISTSFGRLKVKRCENGSLDKECMSLNKDTKGSILKKLRGITRSYPKEKTSYVFNVTYEGIYYKILFDKFHKLKSLSLADIVWTDMMILNDKGVDLNLMMTSTHTLKGERLNHLPLTYELYRGSKKWIDRVDNGKGIQLIDRNEIPCFIISIEAITEKEYKFWKDPALANMTVSELTIELYQGLEKGFIKHSRTNYELRLSAPIETLLNTEFLRTYENVALDLAAVDKNTRTVRRSGNWRTTSGDSTSIPRLPRRPNTSGPQESVADSGSNNSNVPAPYTAQVGENLVQHPTGNACNRASSEYSQHSFTKSMSNELPPSTSNSVSRLARQCRMRTMATSGDHEDFEQLNPHELDNGEAAPTEDSTFQDAEPPVYYPIPSQNSSFTSYQEMGTSANNTHHHPLSYPGVSGFHNPAFREQIDSLDLSTLDGIGAGSQPALDEPLGVSVPVEMTRNTMTNSHWLLTRSITEPDSLSPYSNNSSGPDVEVVSNDNPFEEGENDEPNVSDYEDRNYLD